MKSKFLALALIPVMLCCIPAYANAEESIDSLGSSQIEIADASLVSTAVTNGTPTDTSVFDVEEFYSMIFTEEWRSMERRADRAAALQLPLETLQTMDTETLAKLVSLYPFNVDYLAYDSSRAAFEHLWDDFEAMRVLCERQEPIFALDKASDTALVKSTKFAGATSTSDREGYIVELALSIMLAQPEFTANATTAEKAIIDEWALEIDEPISAQATYASTYVYTPRGTPVLVYQQNITPSIDWINDSNYYWDTRYPLATRVRDANPNYNCHSYAWYSQFIPNPYWMNDPTQYMWDGSYSYVGNTASVARTGDKVYWNGGDHSGIVYGVYPMYLVQYISKWGQAGLYIHHEYDCPYTSAGLNYYR